MVGVGFQGILVDVVVGFRVGVNVGLNGKLVAIRVADCGLLMFVTPKVGVLVGNLTGIGVATVAVGVIDAVILFVALPQEASNNTPNKKHKPICIQKVFCRGPARLISHPPD